MGGHGRREEDREMEENDCDDDLEPAVKRRRADKEAERALYDYKQDEVAEFLAKIFFDVEDAEAADGRTVSGRTL